MAPDSVAGEGGQLIAKLPADGRALWAAALYVRLRRGELRALRSHDINLATALLDAYLDRAESADDARAAVP